MSITFFIMCKIMSFLFFIFKYGIIYIVLLKNIKIISENKFFNCIYIII